MVKKTIFHIGFHKTGTTWFQNYYYPFVTNASYINAINTKDIFVDKNAFDTNYENLKLIDDSNTLIFCHEELSGNIHTGGMNAYVTKGIANRIKSIYPDAKIIIFIRNQIDMIASCYSQYVQEGGTYSVERYLHHLDYKRYWRAPLFSFEHFNYYNVIEYYSNIFGKSNIFIFLYEDFENNINEFIISFEKQLKIHSNWASKSRLNVRYRTVPMALARLRNIFCRNDVLYKYYFCNLPIPGLLKKSNKLLRYLNRYRIFGRVVNSEELLGLSTVQYIKSYYSESNQKLCKKFDIDFKKYKYPD